LGRDNYDQVSYLIIIAISMSTKIDKSILFKYFSGLTTPLENASISQWLEEDGNEEIFYFYLENWERQNAQYLPEKKQVFEKFNGKLESSDSLPSEQNNRLRYLRGMTSNRKWIGIAASVLILTVVIIITHDRILYKDYVTQYGETMTIVLNDESQVVLNANTRLKVPRLLGYYNKREVWVNGEAFFNVSKKENHQKFIVHTNNLDVEVLGTRFNVTDRREATRVVLQEGKVRVVANRDEGEMALLEESGDYAEVKKESTEIITRRVDESLYTAWQDKRLKFQEVALSKVLETIEDYYGVRLSTRDTTLINRKFSGTLPNNDLNIILQALTNVYGSKFTIH